MNEHSLHLLVNTRSGKGLGDSLPRIAKRLCDERQVKLVLYTVEHPGDLDRVAEEAANAARQDGGVLVAGGGDGTLRTVAEHARATPQRSAAKFAAIPCGTFNFFARAHNIPEDPEEALKNALDGEPREARLGEINGKIFLINSSLGLYTRVIKERESAAHRYGRRRIVVILSSLRSLFLGHKDLLEIELSTDQTSQKLRTPMIFIGNNALQLSNLSMTVAGCMKKDFLAVLAMHPLRLIDVGAILVRGFMRTIDDAKRLSSFCVDSLTIRTFRRRNEVALDGSLRHDTSKKEGSAPGQPQGPSTGLLDSNGRPHSAGTQTRVSRSA
jgi:diacylglycerol kinase family enzyme